MAERDHRHDPDHRGDPDQPAPLTADAAVPAVPEPRGAEPAAPAVPAQAPQDGPAEPEAVVPGVAARPAWAGTGTPAHGDREAGTFRHAAWAAGNGHQAAASTGRGFWQALTPLERTDLTVSASEAVFPLGDVLWHEGQTADHLLVIRSGWIRVCVEQEGDERIIALRGPGDIIGERAALLLRQRSATVVAIDDVHALRMTTREFAAYLTDHPRVLGVLEQEMYKRMTEGHAAPSQQAHGAASLGTVSYGPVSYGAGPYQVTHPYGPAAQYGPPQRYATAPHYAANPFGPNLCSSYPHAPHFCAAVPYATYPHGWHPPAVCQNGPSAHGVHPTAHVTAQAMAAQPIAVTPSGAGPGMASLEPTAPTVPATPSWAGQNCTIMFTDIAGFSDTVHRDDDDRLEMRAAMYRFLREAFEESKVPWDDCHAEDRGDGALIVVPPRMPTTAVIDPLIARLAALLRRHNRRSSRAVRIQLRLALHVGPVTPDTEGVAGWPVIQAARLLDARVLKERLAATGADLGFIASSFVYESVIAHSPGYVDAADYEPVHCRVKNTDVHGWMHLLGASPP
ncbi:cyclic nucleotide-binding domain-containing protein [Actinomadura roseirufa]|uniref:cyclic nucleotide-binding domain-containing protein n=1 Tax=Actinomadura roseirufa TaxID=2094049 RepID=UPI0010411E91|nr:cyclic nucleotide-binding domain-containing protein [Actinomadura roseirufa]